MSRRREPVGARRVSDPTAGRPPGPARAALVVRAAIRAYPRRCRVDLGADLLRQCQREAATPGGERGLALNLLRAGIGARLDDAARWMRRHTPSGGRSRSPSPHQPEDRAIMDGFLHDLRHAFRALLGNPGFAIVAVLSLALGIGANAAIFGIVDAALWRQLPVADPDELVMLHWASFDEETPDISHNGWRLSDDSGRGVTSSFAYRDFLDMRAADTPLSDLIAFADLGRINVVHQNAAELGRGQVVSGNYYRFLGVRPHVGRLLTPDDDRPSAPPAVVISHAYWQRRFGADPAVIGRGVAINDHAMTIVGVSEPGFRGTLQVGSSPDVTVPLAQHAALSRGRDRLGDGRYWWLHLMGRRASGATLQQVASSLQPLLDGAFAREAGDDPVGAELQAVDGARGMTELRSLIVEPITMLTGIAGLVLLIACANLANLLLARSSARQRELAVRASLGASRGRIVGQLMTESIVLSTLGGLVGIALAYWTRGVLTGAIDSFRRVDVEMGLDLRVLGFTMLVSLVTALLFGLVPALRSSRVDLTPSLRGARGQHGPGRARLGVPKSFLVVQVAMSLILLVGASLLTRTLVNLQSEVAGFDPANVLLFDLDPTLSSREGPEIAQLYGDVLHRVRAVPGVRAASLGRLTPVAGHMSMASAYVQDVAEGREASGRVFINRVEPGFFGTLGIPLLLGRDLGADDVEGTARVAVVNDAFVQEFFAGQNAIGRRLGFGGEDNAGDIEIVGVVGNVKYQRPDDDMWPAVHLPSAQYLDNLGAMTFALRTEGDPLAAVTTVRAVVSELAPDVPVYNVTTQEARSAEILVQERQLALLATALSGLALALACIGLYGILSYNLVRRTREIGIRMALGARGGDVTRLLLAEARAVGVGILLGLGASYWATRLVEGSLYGLSRTDPGSIGAALLLLVVVAIGAAYPPARRAARIDPVTALRYD